MGKAYGFFQCDASLEEIAAVLPEVREYSETPLPVEFFFMHAGDALLPAPDMMDLLEEGRTHGQNYAVEAFYPGKKHEEAADELKLMLQGLYRSGLYPECQDFFGDIVFKKGRDWEYKD